MRKRIEWLLDSCALKMRSDEIDEVIAALHDSKPEEVDIRVGEWEMEGSWHREVRFIDFYTAKKFITSASVAKLECYVFPCRQLCVIGGIEIDRTPENTIKVLKSIGSTGKTAVSNHCVYYSPSKGMYASFSDNVITIATRVTKGEWYNWRHVQFPIFNKLEQ